MSDPWNPKPAPSPYPQQQPWPSTPAQPSAYPQPAPIGPMSEPLPATNIPAHPAEAKPILPPEIIARLKAKNYPQDHIGALMLWDEAKKAIVAATADEMMLRKYSVQSTFTAPVEGTNRVSIGNGMEAKAVIAFNYNLKSPDPKKDVVDAVDDCIDNFARFDNEEGEFIAKRLFKWKVEMSVAEYRKLVEDAKSSPVKAKLLTELEKVLNITDKAPTLEIVPEKKRK